jgi:hypothetical protein
MSAPYLERMWKFPFLFLLSLQLFPNILQRDGYADVETERNNSAQCTLLLLHIILWQYTACSPPRLTETLRKLAQITVKVT